MIEHGKLKLLDQEKRTVLFESDDQEFSKHFKCSEKALKAFFCEAQITYAKFGVKATYDRKEKILLTEMQKRSRNNPNNQNEGNN